MNGRSCLFWLWCLWLPACNGPASSNTLQRGTESQNVVLAANQQTYKFSRTRGVLQPADIFEQPLSAFVLDSSQEWALLAHMQYSTVLPSTFWVRSETLPGDVRGLRNFRDLLDHATYSCPQNAIQFNGTPRMQQRASSPLLWTWGVQNGWVIGLGNDAPAVMSGHCFMPPERLCDEHNRNVAGPSYFDVHDLERMVHSGSYRSIDELWSAIHAFHNPEKGNVDYDARFEQEHPFDVNGFPYTYAMVYLSKSLQRAGANVDAGVLPRILAANAYGDLLIGIEGKGRSPNEATPETMEVLSFHCEGDNAYFAPALVVQDVAGLRWYAQSDPAPDYLAAQFHSLGPAPSLEQVCQTCHGTSIHPNMHEYPTWPGWMGGLFIETPDSLLRDLSAHSNAARFKEIMNGEWLNQWALVNYDFDKDDGSIRYDTGVSLQLDIMNNAIYRLNSLRIASELIQRHVQGTRDPVFLERMTHAMVELYYPNASRSPDLQKLSKMKGMEGLDTTLAAARVEHEKYLQYLEDLFTASKRVLYGDSSVTLSDRERGLLRDPSFDNREYDIIRWAVLKMVGLSPENWAPVLSVDGITMFDYGSGVSEDAEVYWLPLSPYLVPYMP